MKPKNWETMSQDERMKYATALFQSPRGIYIMSQALHYGIRALESVPAPWTEVSNKQDMEIFRETFFPIPIAENFKVQMVTKIDPRLQS